MPALPPIIKAEGGPNKIIPNDANSQDSAARENANGAGSRERLVSREERPVDIPPPVASTAPRPVATVPVFPDPPRMGGPGAVVGYSAGTPSNNAGSGAEPRVPTAPMTTGTAPNPPSIALAAPESSAPPPVAAPTPGGPGPKKIRTVTIRSDQSTGADGPASTAASQAVVPRSGSQNRSLKAVLRFSVWIGQPL